MGRIVISDSRCGAFFSANNLLLTLASVCRSAVSPRARASHGERPRDSSSLVVRARLDGSQVTFTATGQRAAALGICLQGSKRDACSRTGSHFTLHIYSADEQFLGQANRIAKPGTTQRDKAIPNVKGQVSARRHQTLYLPSRMAALSETTNRRPQRNSAQGYVDRFGRFAGLTAIVKFEENRAGAMSRRCRLSHLPFEHLVL